MVFPLRAIWEAGRPPRLPDPQFVYGCGFLCNDDDK
jgi:hypothetical protein